MEYFTGFIILVGHRCGIVASSLRFQTTNIPGNIDDAFLSRISVPIHFKRLRKDQCHTLWQKYFELHEKEAKVEISEKVKDWIRNDNEPLELNGREIRNGKGDNLI